MDELSFLSMEDFLFIHAQEIQKTGGDPGIRQKKDIQACADALIFLYLNGYEVEESYNLELADLVLDFLSKDISKEDLAKHLKENAVKR